MSEDEKLVLASYVASSTYRQRVLDCFNNTEVKTPTRIARESGVRVNHISKVLTELKNKNLLVCINEDARKGRLYRLTGLGISIREIADTIL